MTSDPSHSEANGGKTGAGLAGAGGGTLLAFVATSLPDTNTLKPWLLYAAPSVSIILGGLWIWTQVKIVNYFRDREFKRVIDQTRKTLEEALANPNTSEEHKKDIRKKLEEFDLLNVDRTMKKLKMLEVATASDVQPQGR